MSAAPDATDVDPEKTEVEEYRMTLLEHLWELRTRLIRSLLAMVVSFSVMLPFGGDISRTLRSAAEPHFPEGGGFAALSTLEVFVTNLKMSLFAAFFLALPVLFYQGWSFVAPGLYRSERRLVVPFVLFSSLFFTAGASFGFTFIVPLAMEFLLAFSTEGIEANISIASYLGDVTKLLLAFGAVFELPLAIFFLARAGIVTADALVAFRKYAVLLTFVVAAVLTPPDPVTQVGLALPLIILYEIGVVTARVWGKKRGVEAEHTP